jgi:uncharacterized protein (TIGR04255 family)
MFGFPKKDKSEGFQFKRNFLKSVVFQVKYDKNNDLLQKKELLISILKDEFPNNKEIQQVGVGFTLKGDKTPIIHSEQRENNGFQFSSKSNDKLLLIQTDSLTLTITGNVYQNFSILEKEIEKINKIFEKCNINTFNRIAIRKSNFIEYTPQQTNNSSVSSLDILPELLNHVLVANSQECPAYEHQKEGVSKMIFIKDGYTLNLQYGVIRTMTPLVNALFLDIDLFSTEKNVERDKLAEILGKVNDEIFNVFSWAITDKLENILNN